MILTRVLPVVAAVLVLVTAATAAVGAESPARHRIGGEFSGRCDFSLRVAFTPPMTSSFRRVRDITRGSGPCWGTFTDRRDRRHRLRGTRVSYAARDSGRTVSCGASHQRGGGRLVFPWGKVRFSLVERRVTGAAPIFYSGADGGSATGVVTVSQRENPLGLVRRCSTSGVREARVDIQFLTAAIVDRGRRGS